MHPFLSAQSCSVPSIPHSTSTAGTIAPGTLVTIQCDEQYTLSHNRPVTCVTLDMFSDELPACSGELIYIVLISDVSLFLSLFKIGHNQYNEKCSSDTSSPAQPCSLPTISYSTWLHPSPLFPGSTTELQCNTGYTAVGERVVKCQSGNVFTPKIACACIGNDRLFYLFIQSNSLAHKIVRLLRFSF